MALNKNNIFIKNIFLLFFDNITINSMTFENFLQKNYYYLKQFFYFLRNNNKFNASKRLKILKTYTKF